MKKYIAEFFGTFVLVFFGCGTAIFTGASVVPTALAFGLALMMDVYMIGKISGCHVNPAVTLGCYLDGKLPAGEVGIYMISQVFGALAASAILKIITVCYGDEADTIKAATGANGFGGELSVNFFGALIFEIIITAIFVLIILKITSDDKYSNIAGIIIGLALTLVHIVGVNVTGTSVNPARSLSAAIFGGVEALKDLWVFIVGPLVGAAVAAIIHKKLLSED